MKPHLVFCHGWALDDHYWDHLRPYLAAYSSTVLDLGYFDSQKPFEIEIKAAPLVGIGHSLGLIKLASLDLPFKAFIGLNAFMDFLGNAPTLRRHRQRAWDQLAQDFETDPQKTLLSFYQKCGFDEPYTQDIQGLQVAKLQHDLNQLRVPIKLPSSIPVLILGSQKDAIVPLFLLEDNFSGQSQVTTRLLPGKSHALGYHQPMMVACLIKDFLDRL